MQPSLAVIVLNYKRPQNIGRIVRDAREALPQASIFILDNAADDGLHTRGDIPWGEVWLHRAAANHGSGARIAIAAEMPFDHFIAIDDDTFLAPRQIAHLADRLRREPGRAHGVWGQRVEMEGAVFSYRHALRRVDAAVSIVNMVYAFSRLQARAALALAARVGLSDWRQIGSVDDILLSCGSPEPPLCHDLGPIEQCPTSNDPGTAQWRAENFGRRREALIGRLLQIRSIAVFSPLKFIALARAAPDR
jgi:hypothetical protein